MENIKKLINFSVKKISVTLGNQVFGIVMAFLLGRAMVFESVSPFALAFVAAYINVNPNNYIFAIILSIVSLLGTLSLGVEVLFLKYLLAFILFGLIYMATSTLSGERRDITVSFTAFSCLLISGIIYLSQMGNLAYDWIMLLFECVICFFISIICSRSMELLYNPFDTNDISTECMTGFFIMMGITVIGFANLKIGEIAIGKSFGAVYIMLISCAGGATMGAAGGIGIGILYSLAMYPAGELVGLYGIIGLVCGMVNKYKRIGTICAFLVCDLCINYISPLGNGATLGVLEAVLACAFFCLIPKRVLISVENIINLGMCDKNDAECSLEVLRGKMNNLSQSLKKLSNIFNEMISVKPKKTIGDYTILVDKTADNVCKRCGLKFICWEREYNSTNDALLSAKNRLYKNGKIVSSDFPLQFTSKCVKLSEFTGELNRQYHKFLIDNMWLKRIEAGKEILVNQLDGVTDIMDNLCDNLSEEAMFEPKLSNVLFYAFEKEYIKCSDITVIKTGRNSFEIVVVLKGNNIRYYKKLSKIASNVTGRNFCLKSFNTDANNKKRGIVKLVESEKYTAVCGVSSRTKEESEICGDSCCHQQIGNNKYLAILSDGMGSGEVARNQADAATEIMRGLKDTGIKSECAVNILNLSLFVRQQNECFATLDAVEIDLYNCNAEFIKIGANSSFVKHSKTGEVEEIKASSMPIGILQKVKHFYYKKTLNPGDIIFIVSDGVHGINDNWLGGFIQTLNENNPQKMSELIVNEAIKNNDYRIKDDMTAMTIILKEA